jgi:hypothetical protein
MVASLVPKLPFGNQRREFGNQIREFGNQIRD